MFLVYWVFAAVLLHILRPDMDPLARTTSEYVVGPYGWIMTPTFFALALALVAVGRGLQQTLAPSRAKRIGVVLVYVAVVGIAVAGVFPGLIGPPQPPPPYDQATMAAYIQKAGPMHDLGGMVAFLALAIALPVLSHHFKLQRDWSPVFGLARALAYLYVAALVGIFVVAALPEIGFLGLGQRILIGAMIVWLVVVGRNLTQPLG